MNHIFLALSAGIYHHELPQKHSWYDEIRFLNRWPWDHQCHCSFGHSGSKIHHFIAFLIASECSNDDVSNFLGYKMGDRSSIFCNFIVVSAVPYWERNSLILVLLDLDHRKSKADRFHNNIQNWNYGNKCNNKIFK